MARRRRKKLPVEPIECTITGGLSHEGRGIAKLDGKTQFVDAALPGEKVSAVYVEKRAQFDELKTVEVIEASDERITPPCGAAEICGGCSLQHMDTDAQIKFKEDTLRQHFQHFGDLAPEEWITPMTGPTLGYRGKARLGVRYVAKKESVLVGFREKRNSFLADMQQCEVLNPKVGHRLLDLRALVASLSVYKELPQFEVALGEDASALVVRHMAALTEEDTEKLIAFGQEHGFHIYLQPKGPDTVHRIWPASSGKHEDRLHYTLQTPDEQEVKLAFHPMDFTQVNADINKKMVHRALEWLDVQKDERVLDLFCGLGNFTVPLATQGKEVVGVEGDEAMVVRGKENASLNGLDNLRFYGANLQTDFTQEEWAAEGFDKILIDPPRSGALDVCNYLTAFGAKRIVYVSCNPATLARDAGVIVEKGYRLVKAGVMDMFPHTAHVESIALFEKV